MPKLTIEYLDEEMASFNHRRGTVVTSARSYHALLRATREMLRYAQENRYKNRNISEYEDGWTDALNKVLDAGESTFVEALNEQG